MTTLDEAIKMATESKADGFIFAVRKSDGVTGIVATVWYDSNEEELREEGEKESQKLINISNWAISGYGFKQD